MNLAERFLGSRFISERPIPEQDLTRKKLALSVAEFAAVSALSFNYVLPLDYNNALPEYSRNRILDFMGPVACGALTRILPTRGRAMLGSFGVNAGWEIGSLVESQIRTIAEPLIGKTETFLGTYDPGDLAAIALGTAAWGVGDYLRRRGSEKFKKVTKSLEAPENYQRYIQTRSASQLAF